MKLSELLKGIQTNSVYTDCEVSDVTDKSSEITKGCVFVCICGARFDGHSVAAEAMERGAAAVIVEKALGLKNQILVPDTRAAYSALCANFYGNPSARLSLIGITGTNGKTTTAFLIKSILDKLGQKTGLLGTVKNIVGDKEYPSALTTPDPKELQRLFAEMVENGCAYCVMEVSSQALAQGRVDGCHFKLAVFTNLTQDHLDYHKTLENYAKAKRRLFEMCDTAVLNLDDAAALSMVEGLPCRVVSFSAKQDEADYTAKNVRCSANGVKYELVTTENIGRAFLPIPGRFMAYNSMGAAVCAIEAGFGFDEVLEALKTASGVPGRVEVVPTDTDYTVLIDYAHTPDGLINILSAMREAAENRVIAVFGCGGDRDKTKRPQMGKIAGDMADIAVVTSDNPRSEDPSAIIEDVLSGMENCKAEIVVRENRTEAIRYALSVAKRGDVVLLAGKGHETYQILNTGKIHYDEREIVRDILNEK